MLKILLPFLVCLTSNLALASTAIYYSESLNKAFIGKLEESKELAIQKAKIKCEAKADDCELITSVENAGHVAIAAHTYKGFSYVTGAKSKKQAESRALNKCIGIYGTCRLITSFHDTVYPPPPPQPTQTCYGAFGPTECGALFSYSGRSNSTGQMINGAP
jgi:hypothetical protein